MRTYAKVLAVSAAAALALSACGRGSDNTSSGSASSSGAAGGFAANALIGVALPQKTSENWVLAEGLFNNGLSSAGFQKDVEFANGGVPEQQNQIQAMITKGAKVIIVGAIDSKQLGTQLKAAKDSGAIVIAYDRELQDTDAVSYYIAYNNEKVGELQGQALLDGMKAKKPNGPYNIELFAGSPDDPNAQVFFDGAMKILQPKIADGTLKVVSGQTSFNQVVTQGWKAENAQKRMDTLISAHYQGGTKIDGVLSPNDTLARAILQSCKQAGITAPVVTGQDSEVESVKSIVSSDPYAQYSTINKDTTNLVKAAIEMVQALQKGQQPVTNATDNNGTKTVPTQYLTPVVVTKANAKEAYQGTSLEQYVQ